MEKPLVSTIMCTYNRRDFVPRAIDSVLAQKADFPFEIIIGDDCSTDGTRDILQEYAEKYPNIVRLNLQEKNQGVGGNWASTVKIARGKYLAMIDDDDYWCDDSRLQVAVDFLESNDEYGVVYTNYYKLYDNKKMVPSGQEFDESQDIVKSLFSGRCSMFFPTFIIRKQLIDTYVNIDDYVKYGFALQDWPTQILIGGHTRYHYNPKPSYAYTVIGESITRTKSYERLTARMQRDKIMTGYLYSKINREDLVFDEDDFDRYIADMLLSLAYKKWDYNTAKKYANLAYQNMKSKFAKNPVSFYLYCFAHFLNSN